MKKSAEIFTILLLAVLSLTATANNLPAGFVYLKDVAPDILQDIRYDSYHNFIGRPVTGYHAAECILTKPAAQALVKVQKELARSGLTLKVFDCYRPQIAVDDFVAWSKQPRQQQMKAEFYPRVDKANFFKLGYVATKSGHSRGSTVDLTMVPIPTLQTDEYHQGQKLVACFAPFKQRFFDSGLDMGTGFDCMDQMAHPNDLKVNLVAYANRMLLHNLMAKYGFDSIETEWWHFTLRDEPYKDIYFNFTIEPEIK